MPTSTRVHVELGVRIGGRWAAREPVVVTARDNAFSVTVGGFAALLPLCTCDRLDEKCRGWHLDDVRRYANDVARTFRPRRKVEWR